MPSNSIGPRIDPRRITGALAGVAIGDAMGMPSEFMTRDQIRTAYGRIEGFRRRVRAISMTEWRQAG